MRPKGCASGGGGGVGGQSLAGSQSLAGGQSLATGGGGVQGCGIGSTRVHFFKRRSEIGCFFPLKSFPVSPILISFNVTCT